MFRAFVARPENGGVLDVDVDTVSDINAYKAGYIDRNKEIVLGLCRQMHL